MRELEKLFNQFLTAKILISFLSCTVSTPLIYENQKEFELDTYKAVQSGSNAPSLPISLKDSKVTFHIVIVCRYINQYYHIYSS